MSRRRSPKSVAEIDKTEKQCSSVDRSGHKSSIPRRLLRARNDGGGVGDREVVGKGGRTTLRRQNADPTRAQLVALFDSEFDAVFQFVLARCGDRSVADDVAADTFLAAANALSSGSEETIGRPWLFVVARRRLIDHWRKSERERNRLIRLLELDPYRNESGRTDDHRSDGSADAVIDALRSLPERQRAAIALRYLDDYSVTEIAEAMEIEYRAAESLLARGRRSFINAWEQR